MKLVNEHWEVGTASRNNGYDIGSTVTDITLDTECNNKKRKIYLSLKTSGTTNLSNLGLKTTVFPVDEVKAGKIEQEDGKALLKTFGLNEQFFCATFNEYQNGNRKWFTNILDSGWDFIQFEVIEDPTILEQLGN